MDVLDWPNRRRSIETLSRCIEIGVEIHQMLLDNQNAESIMSTLSRKYDPLEVFIAVKIIGADIDVDV